MRTRTILGVVFACIMLGLLMTQISTSERPSLLSPENGAQIWDNQVTLKWENTAGIRRVYVDVNNPSGNSHIRFPSLPLSGSVDFTATLWVRFNAQLPVSQHDKIIDFHDGTGFQLNYESTTEGLRFTVRDQNLNEVKLSSSYTPRIGEWHLYTIVFKRGERMAIYEDNRLLAELTAGVPLQLGNWSLQNPGYNAIGFDGVQYPINAAVDDFRIYRRALSPAEVENLWLGRPVDNTNLILWCPMDEGSGTTVSDNSGNGRNGTLMNGPQWRSEGRVLYYEVWLDGSNLDNVRTTSLTLTVPVGDHIWEVVAVLDNGDRLSSETYTFSVLADNIPPAPFRLISPENGAILTSTSVTLTWETSSDNQTGLSGYEVWVDGSLRTTTTSTSYTLQLQAGTHSWLVVAVDRAGNRRYSDNFTFSIVTVRPFTLKAPSGAWIQSPPVLLLWENIQDFSLLRYEVWVDGVNVENTTSNSVLLRNVSSGVHEWWVVAVGSGGERKTSENRFVFGVGSPPEYPRREFTDGFEGDLSAYAVSGMQLTTNAIYGSKSLQNPGTGLGYAYRTDVMMGEEEARISVIFVLESADARPGVGFASDNGVWVYATVNTSTNELWVERRSSYSIFAVTPQAYWKRDPLAGGYMWKERQVDGWYVWSVEYAGVGALSTGRPYKLVLEYSRRSKCTIARLQEVTGNEIASVRTVVDTDAPRYPLVLSYGQAKFDNLRFEFIDTWTYRWRVDLPVNPVLKPTPGTWDQKGAFNPGVAYWNGTFYMVYRGNAVPAPDLGGGTPDSRIGFATSPDGVNWTKHPNPVITDGRPEDPELIVWNNRLYAEYTNVDTSQSRMAWSTNGISWSTPWTIAVNDQYGQHKVVAIIDTQAWPSGRPVSYGGTTYRFFGYKEGGGVIFTNNLEQSNWTVRGGGTVQARNEIWGDSDNPLGDAFIDAEGNVRALICASTREGYVGGTEATVAEAVFDGSQPWNLLRVSTLPFVPVYYGDVRTGDGFNGPEWNDGPNFPGQTILVDNWLYCYYGANDTATGLAVAYYGPEFEYRDLAAVVTGQQATVSLKVRNVGSHSGSGMVTLYLNGQAVESRSFRLDREGENTISFQVQLGSGSNVVWVEAPIPVNEALGISAGQYSFVRPDQAGVQILPVSRLSIGVSPAQAENIPVFVVENLRLSKDNVRPGETVTVSVDVANVGTAAGSRTVVLKVDGAEVDNRTVELAAGQRTTVSFQVSVQEVGTHTVSVDGLSKTLTASRLGPSFAVENLTLSKEKVSRGQKVTVTVVVRNTGDETGSHVVMLKVDGVVVDSKQVSLGPSESQVVSFEISLDEAGEHTVMVEGLSRTLTVVEEGMPVLLFVAIGVVCALAALLALIKFIHP